MYKKHTKDEWEKAYNLYKRGFGPTIISRITGIAKEYLRKRCRQYDLTGLWYTERKENACLNAEMKMAAVEAVERHSLSLAEVIAKFGISACCLDSWLRKYRHGGYKELLAIKPRGRPPKVPKPKRTKGMSEVERLKERIAYLEAENAYLKKLKALDQKENAEMFGIGPKSSEN